MGRALLGTFFGALLGWFIWTPAIGRWDLFFGGIEAITLGVVLLGTPIAGYSFYLWARYGE